MRIRFAARGVVAVALSVVLSMGAFAAPRESIEKGSRDRSNVVVKVLKKIIQALGDGLVTPTP